MSLLFETIKLKYGNPLHLAFHQERLNRTFNYLWNKKSFLLNEVIDIGENWKSKECVKLKVVYNKYGFIHCEVIEYFKKNISKLKLVFDDDMSYNFKYYDRKNIDDYKKELNEDTDILFVKNKMLTDTSIGNIALMKNDLWYTPRKPLMVGTTLLRLNEKQIFHPSDIPYDEINNYEKIRIFNAMISWGEKQDVLTENVFL